MKILHIISNICFDENNDLYNYVYFPKLIEIETEIFYFPLKTNQFYHEIDKLKQILLSLKYDIIHFHSIDSLIFLDIAKECTIVPLVFSFYRFDFLKYNKIEQNDFDKFKVIFTPLKESFSKDNTFTHDTIFLIKESLNVSLNFDNSDINLNNYGVFFNFDKNTIDNIHSTLKTILDTGREVSITWILFKDSDKDLILESKLYAEMRSNIFFEYDINLELNKFTGFIIDKEFLYEKKRNYFICFLLNCIFNGKIIFIDSLSFIEDMFSDNYNCFMIERFNYSHLTHVLHFLISFPEIALNISSNAKKTFLDNYSIDINSHVLKDGYNKAISNK